MSLTAVAAVACHLPAPSALPGSQTTAPALRRPDAPQRAENASSRVLAGKELPASAEDAVERDATQPRAKRRKTSSAAAPPPEPLDPCAAAFLRDTLGAARYSTFVARLFERRLRDASNDETDDAPRVGGASALDFLVKVELVKEVLRKFVPHPYNPVKSLAHAYPGSPSGTVTLTRQTVLTLTGWSNTQFSYWARRVEGISVLRKYDDTLGALSDALERRLAAKDVESRPQLESITGKGLDAHITAISKAHKVSPFLRGRHCSLDPFGAGGMGVVADDAAGIAVPTAVVTAGEQAPIPRTATPMLVSKPTPLSLFSMGQLGSTLSYSVSDSRSSGKRRRDDDGSSGDDDEGGSRDSSPTSPMVHSTLWGYAHAPQLVLSRS